MPNWFTRDGLPGLTPTGKRQVRSVHSNPRHCAPDHFFGFIEFTMLLTGKFIPTVNCVL